MASTLPSNLTSYDFLKTLAVVLMIIDHIGFFFFPDIMWFRVLGRLCVPIWFFLIGYANTREVTRTMYVGTVVMTLSAIMAGQYIFPLTILVTLAITRSIIDGIMVRALRTYETLAGMFFLLLLLSMPAELFFEYGTAGMLFAMIGYMARRPEKVPFERKTIALFIFGVGMVFIIGQGTLLPTLTSDQAVVLLLGTYAVLAMLWFFKPKEYPLLTGQMPWPAVFFLQLFGRRTLEIYVIHVVIFRLVAMAGNPERFGFFQWSLMPEGPLGFLKALTGAA